MSAVGWRMYHCFEIVQSKAIYPNISSSFSTLCQHLVSAWSLERDVRNALLSFRIGFESLSLCHGPEVANAFEAENIDLEGWLSVVVKSRGFPEELYFNLFCPAQGSIFCPFNDKNNDHNDSEDRLHWSEIVCQIYEMEAVRALQPFKSLRTVWRFWIVNSDTVTILREAQRGKLEFRPFVFIAHVFVARTPIDCCTLRLATTFLLPLSKERKADEHMVDSYNAK